MTNYSVIAIYMPFIVGTILILVSIAERDLSKPVLRDYLYFSVSILGWQVCEALFYILNEPEIMKNVYNAKLIFVGLAAIFVFRLVAGFYKLNKKIPSWLTYTMFLVPAITGILGFSSYGDQLLRKDFQIISAYPLSQAEFEMGVWYDFNIIFSNLLVLGVGIIVMIMHYRLPKAYRNPSIAFLFGLFFYAAGYALNIVINPPLDTVLLGSNLANLAIYFVVAKSERGEYLNIAQREIFNYLDEAIFILDEKKRIVDANKTAMEWLHMLGKELTFSSFDEMLNLFEYEELIERNHVEDRDNIEIKLTHTDITLVYEMSEIYMYNDRGDIKGEFVTLEDVTRNSLFIERLEIDAGMDPLTGLQNRYTYEELIIDLDEEENYPISVIVGDVNSLKQINDNYGHLAGDSLLSVIGDTIRNSCPGHGHSARIGGDEFIMLIPKCDEAYAYTVMTSIRNSLKSIDNLPFEVNMALGSVTKTSQGETLRNLVNEADKIMYSDKTREKGVKV